MKISIIAEVPNKNYYRSLFYLEKKGDIDSIEITGPRDILKRPYKIINLIKCLWADKVVLGIAPYNFIIFYFYLVKIIRRNGDIIYFSSWPFWSEDRYRWKPYIPGTRYIWKKFLKNMDAVAVSRRAKEGLRERGANVQQIPHSIDTSVFKPIENKNDSIINILFVGRYEEQKGVNYLLNIAKKLKDENLKFLFVGSGILDDKISSAARKYKNIENIGFVNDATKLSKIYDKADIFVMPSYKKGKWEELFGITIIEAMACGLPVIATDCVGPKEIIDNKKSGFIIPQKNEKLLSDKILLLAKNKMLRKKIGREAIIRASRYDLKDTSEKWKKILGFSVK